MIDTTGFIKGTPECITSDDHAYFMFLAQCAHLALKDFGLVLDKCLAGVTNGDRESI